MNHEAASTSASQTEWEGLRSMSDDEIDYSDIPAIDPAAFARGVVHNGLAPRGGKEQITLCVDKK